MFKFIFIYGYCKYFNIIIIWLVYLKTEDEENCYDADIFTNFLHTKIELSPDFFGKAGKHKVKQINELTDELCKTGETSRRGKIMTK